jgi:predicted nucleic acid-binding protein
VTAATATSVVNIDTGIGFAFVGEGSPVRARLKAFVQGKTMVMCQTARAEFLNAVAKHGGPLEQARAGRLMARLTVVADAPSPRAQALRTTQGVQPPDKIIFGTGDALGAVTATTDAKFTRAAAAQGVVIAAVVFPQFRLQGR